MFGFNPPNHVCVQKLLPDSPVQRTLADVFAPLCQPARQGPAIPPNRTPRIHHQWKPDVLNLEQGVSHDTTQRLIKLGHPIKITGTMGSVQSVAWDGEKFYGSADPRRPGAGAVAVNKVSAPQ